MFDVFFFVSSPGVEGNRELFGSSCDSMIQLVGACSELVQTHLPVGPLTERLVKVGGLWWREKRGGTENGYCLTLIQFFLLPWLSEGFGHFHDPFCGMLFFVTLFVSFIVLLIIYIVLEGYKLK